MTPDSHEPAAASAEPPKPRPYLRARDRHRQLLEAAAAIARREGLDRLSMTGVATQAGVSRQLVYEHFDNLPDLVAALLLDRFGELDTAVASAVAESEAKGLNAALAAARLILSRPAEERHILRALLAHAGSPEHELNELAARLRTRTIDRWRPALQTGDTPASRALVWALVNATLGLGDLVDAAEITVEQATAQLTILINAADPRPHD